MSTTETPFLPSRRRVCIYSASFALLGSLARPATAATPRRTALVIGNALYETLRLNNAARDARLFAATLTELGFEVTLLLDATQAQMLTKVKAWLANASSAEVRLVYFAGHGAQYQGRNFLLPVDAALRSEEDLPAQAFHVDDLSDHLSRFTTGVNLVVLDACRSLPGRPLPPDVKSRNPRLPKWQPGFVPLSAPRGTLIAYSTSPGAAAADNPQSKHSTYTRHLVAQLPTPGLPVEEVFKRTREAVINESKGTQMPWEASSLVGNFCFSPGVAGVCGAVVTLDARPPTTAANRR